MAAQHGRVAGHQALDLDLQFRGQAVQQGRQAGGNDAGELYGVEVVPGSQGLRVEMEVASACFARLKERRRNLAGRTGCGLCGTESLEQVRLSLLPLAGGGPSVEPPAVAQALQQSTGAVHAAAWCSLSGDARIVREDVGRHNALDKTLGAMVRGGMEPAQGFLVVASRASFEMVQKAVMARVHLPPRPRCGPGKAFVVMGAGSREMARKVNRLPPIAQRTRPAEIDMGASIWPLRRALFVVQ